MSFIRIVTFTITGRPKHVILVIWINLSRLQIHLLTSDKNRHLNTNKLVNIQIYIELANQLYDYTIERAFIIDGLISEITFNLIIF